METIFGRTYNTAGSSNADFIIKTRGLVKIQYGNKFIDLIKDGKVNSGALDFITIVENKSDIETATGIYYVRSTGTIHIVVDGKVIDLVGDDIGTTYVSFLGKQEVSGELKHLALTNIGFLYETMLDALDAGISSGIIFVEESNKLYIVTGQGLIEYLMSLPNPITELVVILKNDLLEGALIIRGVGKENALIVGNIHIYKDANSSVIDSGEGALSLRTLGGNRIIIQNNITMAVDTIFEGTASSNMFKSLHATLNTGFRLYMKDDESYLEVDNLIVRNDEVNSFQYPIYWATSNNIIAGIQPVEDGSKTGYEIQLKQENKFEVGDLLSAFVVLDNEEEGFKVALQLFFKVEVVNTEGDRNVVYASLLEDRIDLSLLKLTSEDEIFLRLTNQVIHLCASENRDINLLRFKNGNMDSLSPKSIDEELDLSKIHSRVGDIKELDLKIEVTSMNVTETVTPELEHNLGIYSDLLITKKGHLFNSNQYAPIFRGGPNKNLFPQYEETFEIPDDDDSKVVVTSEWVRRLLKKLLPPGTIVQWSGATIPEGWAMCDGSNGTPNLVGYFIKASNVAGETGGEEEIQLEVNNLPEHTHEFSASSVTTSLDGQHTHAYLAPQAGKSDNANDRSVMEFAATDNTLPAGVHSHTIDMSQAKLAPTGKGTPLKWEPKYYSLIFIMKLDD